MTSAQPKTNATPMDRIRKKPRLSLSSGTSSSASSSSAALSTSSGPSMGRPKSGLMPPSINTSRLHSYAFGSRIPLSGKENNVNSTKPTHSTNSNKPTDNGVKKAEWDANTSSANALLPPKSALKRRPKRRQSLLQVTPAPTTAPTTTAASKATTLLSESNKQHTTPCKPMVRPTASEWTPSTAEKAEMQTPPSIVMVDSVHKPRIVEAVLSPVKPIEFEPTTAADPEFWKARQQFARSALLELKALEERMSLLSEAPSTA